MRLGGINSTLSDTRLIFLFDGFSCLREAFSFPNIGLAYVHEFGVVR